MPFTSGVFANVLGASTAVAGDVIQSAVWDNIHIDYSTALNMIMNQMINTPTDRNIAWMNGGFEIWQRGTGSTSSISVSASTNVYTADRWYINTGANQACTVSAQVGLVGGSNLCARVQRNSGQTGTGIITFGYPLDTDEILRMQGKFVTLSFKVRAGANWSPASGNLGVNLRCGTGALTKYTNGYTNDTAPIQTSINLTTNVASFQATSTVVVPAATTQAEIVIAFTPVGTAGANDYFEIDDVQLEVAYSAAYTFTPTSYDRIAFSRMLEGCKRFYQKTMQYSVAPAAGSGVTASPLTFLSQAAAINGAFWVLCPELRINNTLTAFGAFTATSSAWVSTSNSATYAATVQTSGPRGFFVQAAAAASAGNVYVLHAAVDAGIQ